MHEVSFYFNFIKPSPIREVFNRIAKDKSIINLTLGEPDFDTPSHIVDAAITALKKGETHYTTSYGIYELREAVANRYANLYDAHFDTEEICISQGSSSGIFTTLLSILKPDDEVIIINPYYVMYPSYVRIFRAKPVFVEGKFENQFKPDVAEVEAAVTTKTKAVIVISPNNPTGGIYAADWFQAISDLSQDRHFFVLHDEVYESLAYEPHQSISQWAENNDHLISISSCSKTYAMTGWRIGWVATHHAIIDTIKIAQNYVNLSLNTAAQYGAIAALNGSQQSVEDMKNAYQTRVTYAYKRLRDMGFTLNAPEGAFYVFPSVTNIAKSCIDLTCALLNTAKVGVIPGSAFGSAGAGNFRISCTTSMARLEEGMNRIEDNLETIMKQCSVRNLSRIDFI
jgi:aspartate/methionine/tyrosine aminotransferase